MQARSVLALLLAMAAWIGCGDRHGPSGSPGSGTDGGTERLGETEKKRGLPPALALADSVATLRGGEQHRYVVLLEAQDSLRVEVEQQGIDVVLEFLAPTGASMLQVDHPNGIEGIEPLAVTVTEAGSYLLVIDAPGDSVAGDYRLRVVEQGPADGEDRARSHALKAYLEAEALRFDPATRSQAMSLYQEAVKSGQEAGDVPLGVARCQRRMAYLLYDQGRIQESVDLFEKALPAFRRHTSGWELAPLLNELGYAQRQLGEPSSALGFFDEALAISEGLGHHVGTAVALNNIGVLHDSLGRHEEALRIYDRARSLLRSLDGHSRRLSRILHNIGVAYMALGRSKEALDHLEQALEMRRRLGDERGQAVTLTALGWTHSLSGDEQCALGLYDEALVLRRATEDLLGEATTLDHLGTSYRRMGRYEESLEAYGRALQLLHGTGNRLGEAHTLANLGLVYLALDRPEEALEQDLLALELFRRVGDLQGEATVLLGLARAERLRGHLWRAKEHIEEALELVETVRAQLQGQAFRRSYLAARYDYFEVYIALLMDLHELSPEQGFATQAFEAAERVKARSLEEELASEQSWRDLADSRLRQQEHSLRERIQAREALRRDLASRGESSQTVSRLEREIRGLLAEYRKLDGDLRRSAGFDASTSHASVDLPTVQTSLLDDETTLLAFHLGKERGWLWVVDREGISVFPLPPRVEVQAMAHRVQRDLLRGATKVGRRQAEANAQLLSDRLLGSAFETIDGGRLAVLGDGILANLPLSALPLPGQGTAPQLWIDRFEVVQLPSASVLQLLRQRPRLSSPKTLAVFADPVFEPNDPRTVELDGIEVSSSRDLEAVQRDMSLESIGRLPFSKLEAEAILKLVDDPGQRFAALSFEATRQAVLDTDLTEYRLVHFATHGFLNDRHPSLSGIVFSLVDVEGQRLDGFLRVHEIERLQLRADLVVVSACQTALGEDVRGEGIVGMSQAFLRAGARAVVVSHWSVDDQATAVLMEHFYANMLGDEKLRPSAALRAAQRTLKDTTPWTSPYYWAPFTLQGDWQ